MDKDQIVEVMARAMYEADCLREFPDDDWTSWKRICEIEPLQYEVTEARERARAAWNAAKAVLAEAGMAQMEPSAGARFAKHVKANHPGGRIFEIEMVGIQSTAAILAIEEAYRDGFNAGIASAPD